MNKREIVRSIKAERRATLGFLHTMEPAQYDVPTALPGWRIREVVAHLITTDKASATGAILPVAFTSMDKLEAWNERQVPKWSGRSVPDLLMGLDRWGRRFARFAGGLPSALYRAPIPNPWGRVGGMMLWVRAYDEWIHRQDMRRALGLPDEEVDLASVSEFLLHALGHIALKPLEARAGSVAVSLEGVPLPSWRYDAASKAAGPADGAQPAASIAAPAHAFIMAAAGRDTFDALEAGGRLTVEGDRDLAQAFLALARVV